MYILIDLFAEPIIVTKQDGSVLYFYDFSDAVRFGESNLQRFKVVDVTWS